MPSMREVMNLVESYAQEILPPEREPFWLPDHVKDAKSDRSWEGHEDADCMAICDYGEQVDWDTFVAFIERNKSLLFSNSRLGQVDSIGVGSETHVWKDKKKIERAMYTSGYHDTECWIDSKWEHIIDAEQDKLTISHDKI